MDEYFVTANLMSLAPNPHDGTMLRESCRGHGTEVFAIHSSQAAGLHLSPRERRMVEEVYRFRYAIYCVEHGFTSRNADSARQTIIDELDHNAVHIVVLAGQTILGCGRINFARNALLGEFEDKLGMKQSPGHPGATALATKFMVRTGFRGRGVDRTMVDIMATVVCRFGIHKVFMDCRPELRRYYGRIGFRQCGHEFVHHETGRVVPMVVDLHDMEHLRSVSSLLGANGAVVAMNEARGGGPQ